MNDSQGLEVGDFVVRRKRKRHTSSSFCCCREPGIDFLKDFQGLISGGSEGFLVTLKLNSLSGYSDGLFDFSTGDAAQMNLDDDSLPVNESPLINHANSSETSIPSSEPHVYLEPNSLDPDTGSVNTVDSFLKKCHGAETRKRKTYRAKYRVLSDSNERTATPKPTSRADILLLRSRRVMRAPPSPVSTHTPADTDNDAPTSPISRKIKRQLTRKLGKQKRRHLAERLIDAVRTSSQANDELLQARCKEGDLRVPITLATVPRSLVPDKPRKWSLVDPRKVITPFRVSTFSTKRGRKALTEQTPTSYERVALHRHAPLVTREAVYIDVQAQESSSPCQRKVRRGSLVKKNRVRFCEPLKLDVVSVDAVNKRKRTCKSRPKADTSGLDSRRSKARTPLECEALGEQVGRRSLNMVPVPTRLDTTANKLDGAAAYSGTCSSQSQVDHGFSLATMSPPTGSIPSSSVSELPTSPTVLSPIAPSDKNGSQANNKRSPTLDFDESYPTLEPRLKTLGFPRNW